MSQDEQWEALRDALANLDAAERKATGGTWVQGQAQDGELLADGTGYAGAYEATAEVFVLDEDGDCRSEFFADSVADAALIALLRNAAPALLASARQVVEAHEPGAWWCRGHNPYDERHTRWPCRDIAPLLPLIGGGRYDTR